MEMEEAGGTPPTPLTNQHFHCRKGDFYQCSQITYMLSHLKVHSITSLLTIRIRTWLPKISTMVRLRTATKTATQMMNCKTKPLRMMISMKGLLGGGLTPT